MIDWVFLDLNEQCISYVYVWFKNNSSTIQECGKLNDFFWSKTNLYTNTFNKKKKEIGQIEVGFSLGLLNKYVLSSNKHSKCVLGVRIDANFVVLRLNVAVLAIPLLIFPKEICWNKKKRFPVCWLMRNTV